jgi:hypothetical protein
MRQLYLNMVNTKQTEYLECWKIYMDLVETEYNPEDINYYDWELISHHKDYYLLDMYKKNLNDNMLILIDIVENIIKDITDNTYGYFIIDNNILINNDLIRCNNCRNIWDGNAQCNCSM